MELLRRLMRVLGGRVFWTFALVTFLMAGLLASVNLASRYALKTYVDDQLARTPWDFTVFRAGGDDAQNTTTVTALRAAPHVKQVEVLSVLRARLPATVSATLIDGQLFQTPWLTVMAATDASILPPQLRSMVQEADGSVRTSARPILALVGSDQTTGDAFRALQGAQHFSVEVRLPDVRETIFESAIGGVVRLERNELSRWLMDQMGGPVYIPPVGAVLLMPYNLESDGVVLREFDQLARGTLPQLHQRATAGAEGGTGAGEILDELHMDKGDYLPEVIYVGRLDRAALVSGWNLEESLNNVQEFEDRLLRSLSRKPSDNDDHHHHAAHGEHDVSVRHALSPAMMHSVAWSDSDEGTLSRLQYWSDIDTGADSTNKPRLQNGVWSSGDEKGFRLMPVHEEGEGEHAEIPSTGYIFDSTTKVLLQQMQSMARLIGAVTLLIAIPLLWMGWMLATTLSSLLMLNERRVLGLMRLRGVPGRTLGRVLLTAVASGGFAGGLLGLLAGSVLALLLFEGGALPLHVLLQSEQLVMMVLFLLITVVLSLLVSSKLVDYATTISPLEASGRFAGSETTVTSVRFGPIQAASLLVGTVVLLGWVFGFSPTAAIPDARIRAIAVVSDFLALPLFLYGLITLLASRRTWIQHLMNPIQRLIGGQLVLLTRRHMSAKPHRSVAFLMIVGLMASISLYPTVASVSFQDKAERGAQVQMGSDWRFAFNSPDVVDNVGQLKDGVGSQLAALQSTVERLVSNARQVEGVTSANYMVEALLPNFYMPGTGASGVPLYLVNDVSAFLSDSYTEPELGTDLPFNDIFASVRDGAVAVSPAVMEFWQVERGKQLRLGVDRNNETVTVPVAGAIGHLPGMPARAVTDRQGYVESRVDYLNHLFDRAAYAAIAAGTPAIQDLQVAVPRVILMVRVDPRIAADPAAAAKVNDDLLAAFGIAPLDTHRLSDEVKKVGGSMFVSLAVENMKIYLAGGIVLALIAIFAVALANYQEDRRTLELLRIRGTSLGQLQRFMATMLVSPAMVGLVIGIATAFIAGYGLTNRVWEIREIQSVVQLLKTHLVVSSFTVSIAVLLLGLVAFAAWFIGAWVFRRATTTVRQ